MILPVNIQIYYFLSTVIAGIAVGIMFDTYRIIVGINSPSRILTAIADILFWIFCAMVIFIFFLNTNNGDLRYYTFIGLILGIFFYFKLASKRFIISLRGIIHFILKLFRIMAILIIYPAKYIIYLLKYLLFKINLLASSIRKKLKMRHEKKAKNVKKKVKKTKNPKKK